MKKYILLLLIISTAACSNCDQKLDQEPGNISLHSHSMATLYSYFADEYRALTYQAFNIARERVDDIRSNDPDNKQFAIVVDIDETILDNSPHQALMIASDSNYPYMWNEWCSLADARAVPGALEFLQYADEKGFNVFYVSNRKAKYTQEGSIRNLIALGFPQVDEKHFLLRLEKSEDNPNPSDKQLRRDGILAEGYEIVLLIGDNLGDFYTDESDHDARMAQLETYKAEFGNKFIVLPNAMYGNWATSLGIKDAKTMDSLLLLMTEPFE